MGRDETHALGYEHVDDDPNVSVLIDTMETTAQWDATRRLRTWEREQLRLAEGQRLLDVGCGLGEVALSLAAELGEEGEVVGIDVSTQMLRVARSRAPAGRTRVRFSVGDACEIDEPNAAFDVVRSERTLQWVRDPAAAVAEMKRVLRPGGRVSLIDTDWSSLIIDVGDDDVSRRIRTALQTERRRPSNVGARLHDLASAAGLDVLARTRATQTWTAWNPDDSPAPGGCFSFESLADDVIAADELPSDLRDRFVATIHDAARRGRFSMALTMHAVVAVASTSTSVAPHARRSAAASSSS